MPKKIDNFKNFFMKDVSKLIMNLQALCICSKIWIFFVSTRQLILIAISGFDLLHQKEKKWWTVFFFFFFLHRPIFLVFTP